MESEGLEDAKEEPEDQLDLSLYNCPECEYKGKVKYNLKKHITRGHKNMSVTNMKFLVKNIQCRHCDFKSVYAGSVRYHTQTVHLSSQCEYKTKHRGSLKQHIQGHSEFIGSSPMENLKQHIDCIYKCIRYPCKLCEHQVA